MIGNLIGRKFGKLNVISEGKRNKFDRKTWLCRCDCGKEKFINQHYLIRHSQSCGCEKSSKPRRALLGKKFGKLTVVSFSHIDSRHAIFWNCKCDCGNECIGRGDSLKKNKKRSCGCLQRSIGKENNNYKGYEGISRVVWNKLILNSKNRGRNKTRNIPFDLTIEYVWNLFLKQNKLCAITQLPIRFPSNSKKSCKDGNASLDRIDSSKGYTEDNIQWVHKDINMMKQSFSQAYFIELCKKVVQANA